MWKIAFRGAATFAFSVFGRKIIAVGAAVFLLLATAILADLKMYISAGLAAGLSLIALVVLAFQYRRDIVAKRERVRQQAEAAQRRAAAAEARSEKVDRAKAAVAGMTSSAAEAARAGFSGAREKVQGWRK